jgi:hypothetical protein
MHSLSQPVAMRLDIFSGWNYHVRARLEGMVSAPVGQKIDDENWLI